jgi:hypothetical protein
MGGFIRLSGRGASIRARRGGPLAKPKTQCGSGTTRAIQWITPSFGSVGGALDNTVPDAVNSL